MAFTGQLYNNPNDTDGSGSPVESGIGTQTRTDYFQKKALIEAKKEQYFSQMADVTAMPKNMGKKIKRYHYIPLLDDANINDQGIDAAEVSTVKTVSILVYGPGGSIPEGYPFDGYGAGGSARYITGEAANAVDAENAALEAFNFWAETLVIAGGLGETPIAVSTDGDFVTHITAAIAAGYTFTQPDGTAITAGVTAGDLEAQAVSAHGNLYGSSKDVGAIAAKLPALSEAGGRVNRVGYKRVELEGTIDKFGFFDEYTQESLDFDSDADLEMHIHREAVMGANEMTEDAIQIDLLNGAGVVRYPGVATSNVTLHGDATPTEVTYGDLMRLSIDLDNNRCPKNTKIITGTRMVDTNTIDAARYMYVGSEMIPTLRAMQDSHNNPAFIQIQHYASGGNTAVGEIGSIDQFRIIVVPEMMNWSGAGSNPGAAVGTNTGYRESGGNYDVYPMLVVGSGSFTTIGFQTDGKTVKFKIKHKKPEETHDRADPYGETGFFSIKWYYGTMILRPERLALIKTVAQW